jgi:hypothetical protein
MTANNHNEYFIINKHGKLATAHDSNQCDIECDCDWSWEPSIPSRREVRDYDGNLVVVLPTIEVNGDIEEIAIDLGVDPHGEEFPFWTFSQTHCTSIIFATGAWLDEFCREHNIEIALAVKQRTPLP